MLPPPESLNKRLAKALHRARRIAVLGVGSELRGDDVAGVLVARRIDASCRRARSRRLAGFVGCSAPENLTGEIARFAPTHLVVVDAADLGREPGEVDIIPEENIAGTSFSTHTLPLRIIVDYLAQTAGIRAVILGIQPEHTELCAPPSARVLAAVRRVVAALKRAASG